MSRSEENRSPNGTSLRRTLRFALATWAVLAICAVMNGAFRAFALQTWFDETVARMVSCFMLISIILLIAYLSLSRSRMTYTDGELLLIGTIWLGMTLVFEFGWGHYIMGRSWDVLLVDYDLLKGRLWVLVLVFTLLSPTMVGRYLRKSRPSEGRPSEDPSEQTT